MASFFEKVVWTECTGDQNAQCPRFVNHERLPAYKGKCSDCGSKAREIKRLDPLKVGILAGGLLLLSAGGYAMRARLFSDSAVVVAPGGGSGPGHSGGNGGTSPAAALVTWNLQAVRRGADRQLSGADFDRKGDIYTSREAFTAGDKLRFEISYRTDRIYAFYRNGFEARLLKADSAGRLTLPDPNQWFQLDDRTGTEEFILVASNQSVPNLEPLTGNFDPTVLDQQISKLNSGKDMSVVRIRVPHL